MNLRKELEDILDESITPNKKVFSDYERRIKSNDYSRDENSSSHFCVYFLPFNSTTKKILLGHHKKSGKWLSPGGHIDAGESIYEGLNREIEEELRVKNFFKKRPTPFLLTITRINRKGTECKEHFDIWFLMKTDGSDFNIDMREYHDIKWLSINEARKMVTDRPNSIALDFIENNLT
jgi:8-oxo-dGTP pyrophosphatase MutT (NUDIX family)